MGIMRDEIEHLCERVDVELHTRRDNGRIKAIRAQHDTQGIISITVFIQNHAEYVCKHY